VEQKFIIKKGKIIFYEILLNIIFAPLFLKVEVEQKLIIKKGKIIFYEILLNIIFALRFA
jgi:hypothetical protein